MSARSRQAMRLAYLIEQRTGVRRVECRWHGSGSDRAYSGWHLAWDDGPTIEEVRELVAALAGQVPALDVADLRYDRGRSDLAEAAALLRYLDSHPDQAPEANTFTVNVAFRTTSYPERSEEIWLRRARALQSVDPDTAALTGHTTRALAGHALQGWDAALAWLDGIAAAADHPDIANLATARARRANREMYPDP